MSTVEPAAIWRFHELFVAYLKSRIDFCKKLVSGKIEDRELHELPNAHLPDFDEPGILYLLGSVSGEPGNPLTGSKHARAIRLAQSVLHQIQHGDTEDRKRMARIGERFGVRLAAINVQGLEAECEAACLEVGGQNSGNGKRGSEQPVADPDAVPVFLGDGKYEYGGKPFILQGQLQLVVQALVERRTANMDELIKHSGVSNPSSVLSRGLEKHKMLAPFITMPGEKCSGGYSTTIRALKSK